MAVIHISRSEAASDFDGILTLAANGDEVVIEDSASPAVVLRTAEERPLRRLSESLRLAKEHGPTATLDGEFGRDLEAVINSHPEALVNPWA